MLILFDAVFRLAYGRAINGEGILLDQILAARAADILGKMRHHNIQALSGPLGGNREI